jgi:hypothetical protein
LFAAPSTPELNARKFTFSPSVDEIGAQAPANEHVEKLCEILLTYGFYEKDLGESVTKAKKGDWASIRSTALPKRQGSSLADSNAFSSSPPASPTHQFNARLVCPDDEGYVQGMSDLCAPIYVVMKADEVMTFWCFVAVMEKMVSITIWYD